MEWNLNKYPLAPKQGGQRVRIDIFQATDVSPAFNRRLCKAKKKMIQLCIRNVKVDETVLEKRLPG